MKRLVVCSDGTWSTLGQDRLTNVALTARAVAARDEDGNPQIVYYDNGVGVNVGQFDIMQAALGEGLDYKVLEAYEFLTLNYEPGDQIYFFGYSRGAYTVRSLAGLVRKCGILKRRHADRAHEAITIYRRRDVSADNPEARDFREAYAAAWPKLDAQGQTTFADSTNGSPTYDLRIKYLGVWDTVGALGIPRTLPFSAGVNKKYEFHDLALSRATLNARQAIAIDERRNPFKPALWKNVSDFNAPDQPHRVEQKWFPGDHGAVGGGASTQALSAGPLLWIADGAERAGLVFDRGEGSILWQAQNDLDAIHGPLRDGSWFNLNFLLGLSWRQGVGDIEDVHDYARQRWAHNRRYRPRPLRPISEALKRWSETRG